MTRISLPLIAVTLSSCLVPYPGATSGTSGDTGSATSTTTSASSITTAPTSTTAASSGSGTGTDAPTSTTMEAMNFITGPDPDPAYPPYPPTSCQQGETCRQPGYACVDIDSNEPGFQGRCLRIFDDALYGCNVSLQNCPADYKCTHWGFYGEGFAGACVPLSATPVDLVSPCSALEPYMTFNEDGYTLIYPDDCPAGSQCWGYKDRCTVLCTEEEGGGGTCPLPDHYCGVMRDSVYCIEKCDPLVQDCPEGEACAFVDGYIAGCFLDVSGDEGSLFDHCYASFLCDPGLVCLDTLSAKECEANDQGCCSPFCDLDKPGACPGVGQECVAYFDPDDIPPGYEKLGVCSVPF
jgi:hypothetical protein